MRVDWVVLDQYPDYRISNKGEVYSFKNKRLLKKTLTKGYFYVTLNTNRVWERIAVHRLVAFAFVEGYFDGAFVNHKDGVKTNNQFTNLEWLTNKENMQHAHRTGLIPHGPRTIWMSLKEMDRRIEKRRKENDVNRK